MQYLEDVEDGPEEQEEAKSSKKSRRKFTHHVSFDLGSESSSAYVCNRGTFKQINLQSRAEELFPSPLLYKSHENNRISKRIRTRFRLKDGKKVESDLVEGRDLTKWPPDHARLSFFENGEVSRKAYEESVFGFFLRSGESYLTFKLAPNPKVPFQMGADEVIPMLEDSEENMYTVEPRDLIIHLCAQMINNLVFSAPELGLKYVDRELIHLTLTVPNVYSITHSEMLRKYIGEYLDLSGGAIDLISESDAVAYFAIKELTQVHLQKKRTIPEEVLRAWQG